MCWLDRDTGGNGWRRLRRRAEEGEQRSQPLATRGKRAADLGDAAAVRTDSRDEPFLDLRHVLVDTRERDDGFERGHAVPVCSATMPPASRR